MINRTVQVTGWGIGQATINAVLDGETVFSSDVDLVVPTKDNESEKTAPTVFTFEIPMDFTGTKHMAITVDKAAVEFGYIVANYTAIDHGVISYSTGPDEYADIAEPDSNGVQDPRSKVTINGIEQKADRSLGKGTWHWTVNPGSTFEHNITVSAAGLLD